MKIETEHRIVDLDDGRGGARLEIKVLVNGVRMGTTIVPLSGNKKDIEEFVAGTIDWTEIGNRWFPMGERH